MEDKIENLIKLGLKSDEIPSELKRTCLRMLRPKSSIDKYSYAIKQKIRSAIISNNTENGNGMDMVTKFERLCDQINKLNSITKSKNSASRLDAFLAFIEPLSYSSQSNSIPLMKNLLFPKQSMEQSEQYKSSSTIVDKNEMNQISKLSNESLKSNELVNNFSNDHDEKYNSLSANEKLDDQMSIEIGLIWMSKDIELLILQDLLYIFQDIPAQHIKLDSRTENFIIDPSLHLRAPIKDIILSLCELGWLYMKVHQYINNVEAFDSSKGLIIQAFSFALQEELHDYYRLLAILEQELIRTRHDASNAKESVANTNDYQVKFPDEGRDLVGSDQHYTGTSGLTIIRLRTWMQEPLDRMCLLARLAEGASTLSGGALASRLHGYSIHGDHKTVAIVFRIMKALCAPLYRTLARWILYGDLNDPYNEFFVGSHPHDPKAMTNMWLSTYFIRSSMLPSFLSLELAYKILVIGKSINFIRLCQSRYQKILMTKAKMESQQQRNKNRITSRSSSLRRLGLKQRHNNQNLDDSVANALGFQTFDDYETLNEQQQDEIFQQSVMKSVSFKEVFRDVRHTEEEESTVSGMNDKDHQQTFLNDINLSLSEGTENELLNLEYGSESRLTDIVMTISTSIDKRLLFIMENYFHLSEHLLALKKYMLLGQGDFITCLMDMIGPELQKNASKLYRHNLTGILQGALRSSNAQFEPSHIMNRIIVRLNDVKPGEIGWEAFTLDYAVDSPLNAIIHTEAMEKYRKAFQLLWRLKRVEWSLNTGWKNLTTLSKSSTSSGDRSGSRRGVRTAWLQHLKSLCPIIHKCTLARANMTHVINNLCGFLMFEVLETAWIKFEEGMNNVNNIDDIIRIHDEYLNEILERASLSFENEILNLQIQKLLQSILRFCSLENTLITDATVAISKRRRIFEATTVSQSTSHEKSVKRTQSFSMGHNSNKEPLKSHVSSYDMKDQIDLASFMNELDPPGTYDGVPAYTVTRVEQAIQDYNICLHMLMRILHQPSYSYGQTTPSNMINRFTNDNMRFLMFRLDFNDYYESNLKDNQTFTGASYNQYEDDPLNQESISGTSGIGTISTVAQPSDRSDLKGFRFYNESSLEFSNSFSSLPSMRNEPSTTTSVISSDRNLPPKTITASKQYDRPKSLPRGVKKITSTVPGIADTMPSQSEEHDSTFRKTASSIRSRSNPRGSNRPN